MKKKEKLTPFLSKKEIAELKYAEKKILEIQKMLEDAKKEFEQQQKNKEDDNLPIIFK